MENGEVCSGVPEFVCGGEIDQVVFQHPDQRICIVTNNGLRFRQSRQMMRTRHIIINNDPFRQCRIAV